jgi:excisionase family DNA binding protein
MSKDSRKKDELLTPAEVSEILEISKQRVSQLLKSGKLKAKTIDGKYLIRLEDVEAIRERKTGRPRKDDVTTSKPETQREILKITIEAIVTIERKSNNEIDEDKSESDDG